LLQWTIFSSLFMRDLTLHSATSFGKVSYQYDYLLTSYAYKDYPGNRLSVQQGVA